MQINLPTNTGDWKIPVPEDPAWDDNARRSAAITALVNAGAGHLLPNVSNETLLQMNKDELDNRINELVQWEAPLEEKVPEAQAIRAASADIASVELSQAALENRFRSESGSPGRSLSEIKADRMAAQQEALEAISTIIDTESRGGESLAVAAAEFGENVVVPTFSYIRMINAFGEAFPELDIGGTDYLVPSRVITRVQEHIKSVADDPVLLDAARRQLQRVVTENSGILTEGGFEAYNWMQSLMTNWNGDDPNWLMAENVFALLELVGIGLIARQGAKGLRSVTRSGVLRGSPAESALRSRAGLRAVNDMANAPDGAERLATAGLDEAALIDATTLPRTPNLKQPGYASATAATPVAPVESIYLTADEQLKAVETANLWPGNRAKDSVVERLEDGTHAVTQRFGRTDGQPFRNMEEVRDAMQLAGITDYEVIRIGAAATQEAAAAGPARRSLRQQVAAGPDAAGRGLQGELMSGPRGYLVQLKQQIVPSIGSVGTFDPSVVRGYNVLGQTLAFTPDYVIPKTMAAAISSTEQTRLNQMLAPLRKLTGSRQEAVLRQLEAGDGVGWKTADELEAMGWDEGMIAGYRGAVDMSERAWSISNARARQSLELEGYRHSFKLDDIGEQVAFAKPVTRVENEVLHLDSRTGRKIGATEEGQFYRFNEPVQMDGRWFNYGFRPAQSSVAVDGLPANVLVKRPGHIQRVNQHTHYIEKIVDRVVDGVPTQQRVIVAGARSAKRADEIQATLAARNPSIQYSARPARESEFGVEGAAAREGIEGGLAGRFITHRLDEAIVDYDTGTANLLSVSDTLNRMAHSAAMQQGVGVWADVNIRRLQQSFPNAKFSLARGEPEWSAIPTAAERNAAQRVFNDIRATVGLDENTAGRWTLGLRKWLFDTTLDLGGPAGLARELGGLSGKTLRIAKNATASTMLVTNFARQFLMNLTMIPSYFGIEGAAGYAIRGHFLRDMSVLMSARLGDEAAMSTGKALGLTPNQTRKLLDDIKASKLDGLVDDHIFLMDTMFSGSRIAGRTQAGRAVEAGLNVLADVGIRAGARLDKYAAFLLARNRWMVRNGGKLPKQKDIPEIMSFAENELTLGLSRADVSPLQRGSLSVLTQFMGHTLKMTGRLGAQARALVSDKGVGQLSASELRRMFLINLAGWGSAGYGGFLAAEAISNATGVELPEEVTHLINEGVNSYMASKAFGMLDALAENPDEDVTRLAMSETFSPTGFIGTLVPGIVGAVRTFASGGINGDLDLPGLSIPALNLTGSIVEAASLGKALAMSGVVSGAETTDIVLERAARTFPLVNNIVRGIEMVTTGHARDRNGRAISTATVGEGVARGLFGIGTQEEAAYYDAIQIQYGEYYEKASDTAVAKAIQDQVDADWPIIEAVLGNTEQAGQIKRVEELLYDLRAVRQNQLGHEWDRYATYMRRKAYRWLEDGTKVEKLAERMLSDLQTRRQLPTANLLDSLKGIGDFEGKDRVVEYLEGLIDKGIVVEVD